MLIPAIVGGFAGFKAVTSIFKEINAAAAGIDVVQKLTAGEKLTAFAANVSGKFTALKGSITGAWADDDDESWKARIYRYPGQISEIAHERSDGDLWVEWIVDARWLRAWIDAKNRHRGVEKNDEFSRFASLDGRATSFIVEKRARVALFVRRRRLDVV